ncbi:hypothetical protein HOK021_40070 [Streptomyces hygroscopicus]|nr:hypothetical protein HOK021_40070 [Streptomyces hygroscopicus]
MRFVVPVRTVSAAPSPKYFGFKRGITWLNAVNDQVAGIGQLVVPGTPRDSLHILDALLNLDGGVKPEMVATDNASYSDLVFGLFKILGYNFSPRFRDLDDQRFRRATMPGVETGTYGAVKDLARNRVNLSKVITHWPDMLKVAGSLVTNQVRAYDLLRMFGRDGRPTPLGVAFAEYGRIAKTEHLLRVVDPVDDTYRRQMNRQLTVQESRHKLARGPSVTTTRQPPAWSLKPEEPGADTPPATTHGDTMDGLNEEYATPQHASTPVPRPDHLRSRERYSPGAVPRARLKARLKACGEPYPTAPEIDSTGSSVSRSRTDARSMRHCVT